MALRQKRSVHPSQDRMFPCTQSLEPRLLLSTYYVDQVIGSDSYNGRQVTVSGSAGPFKTIQKAASLAVAGDVVQIRAGTYRETVRPANSGTSSSPIVFKPYNRESVTISGTEPITGWTQYSGNIYVASMAGNFFSAAQPGTGDPAKLYDAAVHNQADQIFVNRQMMTVARWPNLLTSLDISQPVKAVTDTFISKTLGADNWTTGVVTDTDINSLNANLFTNAEIYFQPNNAQAWSWAFTGYVTAKSGSQLTFKSRSDAGKDFNATVYDPSSRYYVFNKLELLDAPGEWYHDKVNGKLYLWAPGGSNPQGLVEAKKREYAFDLDSRNYITVEGISLFACSITTDLAAGGDNIGYTSTGATRYPWRNSAYGRSAPPYNDATSTGIILDRLDVRYPTHYTDVSGDFNCQWGQSSGIVLSGTGHTLRNSRIQYSAGSGVVVIGRQSRIYSNQILDTNYMATNLGAVSTGGTDRGSSDHEIGYNTIARAGKHGIQASSFYRTSITDGSTWQGRIHHNDISDFAIQDADTGGIYSYGKSTFVRWDHNWIHDAHPNVDNIPGAGNYTVGGLYPDISGNTIIDHNVVWNVEWAIHTQGQAVSTASNYLIYNNTLRVKRFAASVTYGPFGIVKNNGSATALGSVLRNNIISNSDAASGYRATDYPKTASDPIYSQNLEWDNVTGSGTDPRFANVNGSGGSDFAIGSASAARDTGGLIPAYTRDGITVPAFNDPVVGSAPDRGAYEYGGTIWTAGADLTPPAAPTLRINDGASQRSMVTSLTLVFPEPVTLGTGAVSLLLSSGSAVPNTQTTLSNPSADQKTYLLTFSGTAVIGGSLADGIYDVKVTATAVLDLAGNAMAADYSTRFHRLFGDTNGDKRVNLIDYRSMRLTLGRSSGNALFNAALDHDANGLVNVADFGKFRRRFGEILVY